MAKLGSKNKEIIAKMLTNPKVCIKILSHCM